MQEDTNANQEAIAEPSCWLTNMELSEEQWAKRRFVMDDIDPLVFDASKREITRLDYRVSRTSGTEVVEAYSKGNYLVCSVNVTGDSLWAIVKDVVRALDNHI